MRPRFRRIVVIYPPLLAHAFGVRRALDELDYDPGDVLRLHAHQIGPELVHVLLGQMARRERTIGRFDPRQPGIEMGATGGSRSNGTESAQVM
jgi:hypothetical protein